MQVKRPKRKDCVQRLAERRFAEARGSAAVEGFMRGLLMRMGLSREGAELVRDSLNTAEVERDTAMKTLRDISASPRNRGARRYARATIAFLDALREEKAKQPNDQAQRPA